MKFWTRIEQAFKRNGLRFLESLCGRKVLTAAGMDKQSIKRVLVIRQHDQLGDFLLTTPVLRAVHETWPAASVAVLVRSYTEPVVRRNRYVDDILVLNEVGYAWSPAKIKKFWRQLRSGFDLTIVINTVSHSLSTDLLVWLSSARYTLGPSHHLFPGTSRNFFYNLIAPFSDDDRHQAEKILSIVRYVGIDTRDLSSHITLTGDEKAEARNELEKMGFDLYRAIIGIHPGAGKLKNRWPTAKFVETAKICRRELDVQILMFHGPAETDLRDQFLRELSVPVYFGRDLRKLAAIFSCLSFFIGNDTGTTHMVAAVGTPLIVIFGPTPAQEWKPWGDKISALQGKNGDCENVAVETVLEIVKQKYTAKNSTIS